MRPNETQALDFDLAWEDDGDWWRDQDAALEREELERIETMADIEELRHYGYWD